MRRRRGSRSPGLHQGAADATYRLPRRSRSSCEGRSVVSSPAFGYDRRVPTREPALKKLGENLRREREARKISREAVAEQADLKRTYIGGVQDTAATLGLCRNAFFPVHESNKGTPQRAKNAAVASSNDGVRVRSSALPRGIQITVPSRARVSSTRYLFIRYC